jgi:hypothetical protein
VFRDLASYLGTQNADRVKNHRAQQEAAGVRRTIKSDKELVTIRSLTMLVPLLSANCVATVSIRKQIAFVAMSLGRVDRPPMFATYEEEFYDVLAADAQRETVEDEPTYEEPDANSPPILAQEMYFVPPSLHNAAWLCKTALRLSLNFLIPLDHPKRSWWLREVVDLCGLNEKGKATASAQRLRRMLAE